MMMEDFQTQRHASDTHHAFPLDEGKRCFIEVSSALCVSC
jgi:hypothetical protein